ncbi:MAG: ATP-binding protein [Caulobacterales bacterium]
MFRSSSLRLAALYTAVFAVAVVLLGATTLYATRQALSAQFEARIRTETAGLEQEYRTEGLDGVLEAVHERDETPGALEYGLRGPGGGALAGRLASADAPLGWSTLQLPDGAEHREAVRVYASPLGGGYRLLVGDETEHSEALDTLLLQHFGLAFLGVVLLGVAGGYGLSRGVNRRLTAMNNAAEAIIDGDLSRRIPVRGASDDLDRLAGTLNRMLDRIESLMHSLRQVSDDIAHDLRTPLTRLRQRLEAALEPGAREDVSATLEGALGDLDAILATFAALLRIAQIDRGGRRAGFQPTDLAVVARTVVEAFAPSAEESGAALNLAADDPVMVDGDAELLTQMLVNLVENALRHAGPGAATVVRVSQADGGAVLSVADNGPGVPKAERERLFDRFYRLEASRSTPGSGLGLALVASVARLHGADVTLDDAAPGLEVRVRFPPVVGD